MMTFCTIFDNYQILFMDHAIVLKEILDTVEPHNDGCQGTNKFHLLQGDQSHLAKTIKLLFFDAKSQ